MHLMICIICITATLILHKCEPGIDVNLGEVKNIWWEHTSGWKEYAAQGYHIEQDART